MSLIDLLRMSSSSLKRRKLRTFLTVLGVVIGTASIVVMISLGLGLQKSVYEEVEKSGGVTTINVSGKSAGSGGGVFAGTGQEEADQYITDETIQELKKIPHVTLASPVLTMSSVMLQGNYIGNIELQGMDQETLKQLNIPLKEGGRLPKENGSTLDLVMGNMVIQQFYEKGSGKGYWDTGIMPNVDFVKKSSFLILDQEAYFNSQQENGQAFGNSSKEDSQDKEKKTAPPKKYLIHASGEVEGGMESYSNHSYSVYCDLTTLKKVLKKEYAGKAIPGQPVKKNGNPYPYLTYSSSYIQVDDMNNVEAVSETIKSLGYNTSSNMEMLDSMKKQMAMIQAVLGGIGAVSLFVAAIGIANTMMMSIYERTKEIGVIKVLGCGLKNIKQMFLLEAGFIGLFGGIAGNILSFLLSFGINTVAKSAGDSMGIQGNISYIPPWLALSALLFAVFVGMVAGYFPALRAMRLSPLAAIRGE